jgi:hypothetical protein
VFNRNVGKILYIAVTSLIFILAKPPLLHQEVALIPNLPVRALKFLSFALEFHVGGGRPPRLSQGWLKV